MMTKTLFSLVSLTALCAPTAPAQERKETKLKISKIVLYKHGIGYFERRGTVSGSATIPLTFKTEQMKDVLKSLFAVDLGGGRISTIHYDSKDPLARQLDEILFKVPEGNALTQFLKQLKGARVKVTIGATAIEGNILGIEPIQKQIDGGTTTSYKLVLLRSDGGIQPVELLEASDVMVLDETLRADLSRMMEIYAKSRHVDRKVVDVRAEGDGEREIRAGYIIETPIWKTSYRLLFEDDKPPLLQGWAIVENRTDEDWDNVALSFVAGSPISFVMDLYTSYYPVRPVVQVAAGAADQAQAFTAGRAELKAVAEKGGGGARKAPEAARRARPGAAAEGENMDKDAGADAAPPAPTLGELLEQSVTPAAQGVAVGDLFAYAASSPVTIKQGRAALVPILLERLDKSERVLYYRSDLSKHPAHAALLFDSTALTLEKGPVTAFHGSTYLGEGLLAKTLKPGMREMVPYALEAGVELDAQSKSTPQPVTRSRLANGILTLVRREVWETAYAIRNKAGKAYVFYLDHPKAGGDFKLVQPEKPEEVLPGHYRFRMNLAATGDAQFPVREEREVSNEVALLSQNTEQIRFYMRQDFVKDTTKQFLEKIAALMDERAAIDGRIRQATEERNRLVQDQTRIRENMNALRDSPKERTMRDQLLEKLGKGGERIEALEAQLNEDARKRQEIDERLAREVQAFKD